MICKIPAKNKGARQRTPERTHQVKKEQTGCARCEPEPERWFAPPSGGVVVRTAPTQRPTGAALFGKEFQRRYSWLESLASRDRESVSGRAARRTHRASVLLLILLIRPLGAPERLLRVVRPPDPLC